MRLWCSASESTRANLHLLPCLAFACHADAQYRAKNDIWNGLSAGFLSGVILAKNAGPFAALTGGLGFAGFSGAIDWYMRKPPADDE